MNTRSYELMDGGRVPVKAWVQGVPFDETARAQLANVANLPFIHRWVAAMPDAHAGKGATVGSIIPTKGAIVPAAVGVDIGCGMNAVRLSLKAADLPESLRAIRNDIERSIPLGPGGAHSYPKGGNWMAPFGTGFDVIVAKHPRLKPRDPAKWVKQMGTLGSGNHFIELCLDENDDVWVMLHSGSRGIGNMIGTYFIEQAKREMQRQFISLPDRDLAYLAEGSTLFDDYIEALHWAQDYALENRRQMMEAVLRALRKHLKPFQLTQEAINCHHNYVARESHYGENVWVTRKGAIRAREGDLGIIPGSMGARSFIVRGKGNAESFCSCSHGAGRTMSRTEAKRRYTLAEHAAATEGVECRKDVGVIDETPMAYKPIDAVMAAQKDLVEVVHTLRQVVCVKG
jgi:tRNA-splicing ligase RtcB (3'-phosphate/5'-hydroxy nucleic acid ligase)